MRELTYAEALREGIRQMMEKDNSIFVIGEDVGVYGGAFGVTAGLIDLYGADRIIDTPISEAAIAGACIGAALTGMRPIGEMQFMDFVTIAMEQLVLQAAKIRYMFGVLRVDPARVQPPSIRAVLNRGSSMCRG
jgi:pyruvate/2-oxoglutarate/acetoin dehydrogenase E1 component